MMFLTMDVTKLSQFTEPSGWLWLESNRAQAKPKPLRSMPSLARLWSAWLG